MSRLSAALASVVFLFVAPGVVAGVVPWWITRWQPRSTLRGAKHGAWLELCLHVLGVGLICLGIFILLETFARFAFEGLGTPAPVLPTQHLVIKGSYRYVRNPMYVALLCLIYGQALVLLDWRLAVYGVIVWLCSHLFIRWYEEPVLRRTFGEEYIAYCADVPRWLPRLKARA